MIGQIKTAVVRSNAAKQQRKHHCINQSLQKYILLQLHGLWATNHQNKMSKNQSFHSSLI